MVRPHLARIDQAVYDRFPCSHRRQHDFAVKSKQHIIGAAKLRSDGPLYLPPHMYVTPPVGLSCSVSISSPPPFTASAMFTAYFGYHGTIYLSLLCSAASALTVPRILPTYRIDVSSCSIAVHDYI